MFGLKINKAKARLHLQNKTSSTKYDVSSSMSLWSLSPVIKFLYKTILVLPVTCQHSCSPLRCYSLAFPINTAAAAILSPLLVTTEDIGLTNYNIVNLN